MKAISSECEWWWPFNGLVIASQRPTEVYWDASRVLHCENGPAVKYADGYKLYSWHGTSVPEHWIEDRSNLDPNEVIQIQNVEQRAAGAQICGWSKMLSILKSTIIDESEDGLFPANDIGSLIELTLPGLEQPGRFLKAICPRNGIICEEVPYNSTVNGEPILTARAAQAWRRGKTAATYRHAEFRT